MLRPSCGLPACQLRTREPLRLLDVGLVEGVYAQALTQRSGRILPAQELGPEIARVGGKHVGPRRLHIRRGAARRILDDGNHATSILAGAFGDELLDPVRERRDARWRGQAQLVTPALRAIGDRAAERLRRGDVDAARSFE